MKILFLGSGAFGLPTLVDLAARHTIAGVVTQPDRPAGRGRALAPTPIGEWAAKHLPGVPVFKPEDVNEPAARDAIRAIPAEAWVVIAFGQKLGRELLRDRFAINLHASLLPRWRGAAPIHHAILAGDAETGNSVITIAERMDAGLVLGQSRRAITPDLTAGDLHDLLAADGPALVERVLAEHAAGTLRGEAQDESRVTRATKLSKRDGWADFTKPAGECLRRIHGLNPWPGVAARLGEVELKLCRAKVLAGEGGANDAAPGALVDAARGVVACGGGTALQLAEVQPAGKGPMTWEAFARGRAVAPGCRIESGDAR